MSKEKTIREWLGMLPEPIRTEALAAMVECETATSVADAIMKMCWPFTDQSPSKWNGIYFRALAGEFDAPAQPTEVEVLRERVRVLEDALKNTLSLAENVDIDRGHVGPCATDMGCDDQRAAVYYASVILERARAILNDKKP